MSIGYEVSSSQTVYFAPFESSVKDQNFRLHFSVSNVHPESIHQICHLTVNILLILKQMNLAGMLWLMRIAIHKFSDLAEFQNFRMKMVMCNV